MRFTVPNIIPSLNSEASTQQQDLHRIDSYVLRGSQPSFQEFLQQIQNNLLENQIIDEDTVVMVSFNQGQGQIVLGFLKTNQPNKRMNIAPNMDLMQEAIEQHKQKQLELLSSLKTGIQKVKVNRWTYKTSMQLIRSNSLPQATLQTLKKAIGLETQLSQPEEDEIMIQKPRSLSEQTFDEPDQFQKGDTNQFLQRQQKRSQCGKSPSSHGETQSIY